MEDFYKAKTNTKISVVYILSYIKNLNSHQIQRSKNKMQEHIMESK